MAPSTHLPARKPKDYTSKPMDHKWVKPDHHKVFRVKKHGKYEIDVLLDFGKHVDYRVVKLSTDLLPTHYKGRKIHWLSAFGVQSHGKYVPNVHYTAFFCVPSGRHLLRYERGKLVARPHPGKGIMWMDFTSGDPAVGCD